MVVGLTVGTLASEVAVRWIAPQQLILLRDDVWMPVAGLGHRHCENANTRINTGEGEVRFITDQSGFRISSDMADKVHGNSNEVEIAGITLGDSFVEAIQVENEQTMTKQLQRNLSEQLNTSVRIDNAGVGNWNPNHYLLEAKRALAEKRYDFGLVFIYLGNDILREEKQYYPPRRSVKRHSFGWPLGFSRQAVIDSWLYPVNDLLETRSHLFMLIKKAMALPLAKCGLTALSFPPQYIEGGVPEEHWTITTEVCEKIHDEFAKLSIPVMFVFLPAPFQVHDEVLEQYVWSFSVDRDTMDVELPNKKLSQLFSQSGIKFIDTLPGMRKAASENRLYGTVDQHLNSDGHRVVAEILSAEATEFVEGVERMRAPE